MLIDREYLLEIDARDASGVTVMLRYSRDGFMTRRTDTPPDTVYDPRISDPGSLALYLWDAGTAGGSSQVGWGSVVLHNQDGALDYLLVDGYGLAGVAVRIKVGTPAAPLPDFVQIFAGTCEAIDFDADGTVRLALRDLRHMLSTEPLQSSLYAGTNDPPNGVEGLARDIKGKGKPRGYGGRILNAPAPLVNAQRLIYQVSDRQIGSIDGVFDRGVPLDVGREYSRSAIVGDGVTPVMYTRSFTSANVNASANTVALGGAALTPGDRVKFSFPSDVNLFPGGLRLSSGSMFSTKPYYLRNKDGSTGFADFSFHDTNADATSGANRVNLTTTGATGITYAIRGNGYTEYISGGAGGGFDITNDTFPSNSYFFQTGTVVYVSYPAGTEFLPAPLVAGQDYFLGGASSPYTLHRSQAEAVAGSNPIDLTSAGRSGVTFTATVFSWAEIVDLDDWLDFDQAGVQITFDYITTGVSHGIANGQPVRVRRKPGAGGSLPGGLSASVLYYARARNATQIQFHPTKADAIADTNKVNITSTGSSGFNQITTNTVAPGEFCFSNDATGCFIRLGTKPTGLLTVDFTATSTPADCTTAQVLKQIAIDAGVAPGDISAADVSALDALAPAEVAEYLKIDDQRSARTVMDAVAESVGAWFAFDATGKLRMGRLDAPTAAPTLSLTADSAFSVERTQAGGDGSGVPNWRSTLSYAPVHAVQTSDQLAGAVTDDRAALVGREWREAVSEAPEVLDVHPGAPARGFTTRLVGDADATDEVARRQTLYGSRRDLLRVRVPLTDAVLAAPLGGVVSIQWPRLGLAAGRSMLLIGAEMEWASDQAWLMLWG